MKYYLSFITVVFIANLAFAQDAGIRLKHHNLKDDAVGLHGYDPVSYHQGTPREGASSIRHTHGGVTYYFASTANRDAFVANPVAYEPAYGGWCAWAMLEGDKTDVDPESYKIIDGKLYVYYKGFFGDTRKSWNKKARNTPEQTLVATANDEWADILKK